MVFSEQLIVHHPPATSIAPSKKPGKVPRDEPIPDIGQSQPVEPFSATASGSGRGRSGNAAIVTINTVRIEVRDGGVASSITAEPELGGTVTANGEYPAVRSGARIDLRRFG